jgi:hypothetical protein
MQAFEATGTIEPGGHLHLETPVPIAHSRRVRVLILLDEPSVLEEAEWLRAVSKSPSFDFLREPAEDLYSIEDGKPFDDQG